MDKLVSLFKNNNFQSFLCGILGSFIVFILFGIDFSLSGSLAEWLSAVGTIGAVWVSLWIVFDEKKVKVAIVVKKLRKETVSPEGINMYGQFSSIEVYAYNHSAKPIAISFMGIRPQGDDKDDYIEEISQLVENPKLEFIQPGMVGKKYCEDIKYLSDVSKRYIKEDGTLNLEAVFVDINGKEHLKDIVITDIL